MTKVPDWKYWRDCDVWEVRQGVQLLLGVSPQDHPDSHYGHYGRDHSSKLLAKYKKLLELAKQALEVGTLQPFDRFRESGRALEYRRVRPMDFLQWAISKNIDIHEELLPVLDTASEQQESAADNLDPRERTTLLQIIAVLAAEANLDLTKHSKAAETLQAMGAEYGLALPKKKDTIADKLREARDLPKTR